MITKLGKIIFLLAMFFGILITTGCCKLGGGVNKVSVKAELGDIDLKKLDVTAADLIVECSFNCCIRDEEGKRMVAHLEREVLQQFDYFIEEKITKERLNEVRSAAGDVLAEIRKNRCTAAITAAPGAVGIIGPVKALSDKEIWNKIYNDFEK